MRSGISREAMDTAVRPQDDLYGHVNGGWIARTEIPADRGRYGTFDILRERAEEDMRALLEEARDGGGEDPAVRLYAAFLDEAAVEAAGLTPIEPLLGDVAAVDSPRRLLGLLGRLQREGTGGLFSAYVNTDARDSVRYVVYLTQSGLGLPDESYYREEQYEAIRAAYVDHLGRLLTLRGHSAPDAIAAAHAVMGLETALAAGHWDRVATRDAVKSYTKMDAAALHELAPNVDWPAWAAGAHAPEGALGEVVVRQPSFLEAASRLLLEMPIETWRSWLECQVLHAYSPYLPSAFVAENFDFYGRTLTGTPEMRARWRRGVALVDQLVGEAAGRLYVDRHFRPEAKARASELVANLVEAYRRDISELAWMSPITREKALEKLAAFTPKIGYPDRWRDYSGMRLTGDLVGDVRSAYAFETDRDWAKLGTEIDRAEWFMNPQTVNAYFNPGMNEIVFPAAILQPPFFDAQADDAVNYGAIGSVIGHEIGHGFDDQGSRYDGAGNLVDWWTDEDRAAFDALAAKLIAQYDAFTPRDLPGEHVNGALTVGENIGDLGGVTIAHLAYRIALDGAEPAVIDDLTGDQRFFAGWAQIWAMRARPEEAKRLLAIDPHSPGEFRANIVRNLSEFHAAFDVREGDGLWLAPQDRVRIW